jgi:hypothetical protein
MAKKGEAKQVPLEQRGRGLNPEHPEGQDNEKNRQAQAGAAAPPKKSSSLQA